MNHETRSFYHRRTFTWTHIVWDPATRKAVIIDPVLDYEPASGRTGIDSARELLDFVAAKALDVTLILETHAHADHLTAAARLKSELGCSVAIGKGICGVQETFRDVFNLGDSLIPDGSQFDRLLEDGEVIPLGDLEIHVMNTPGHTDDSVTYVIGESAYIGDTMFMPALGTARCDFPGGDAARLYDSIQAILDLGEGTVLFLCHDYPADGAAPTSHITAAEQRCGNIHLRHDVGKEEFIRIRTERDAKLSMPALILPSIQVNIRAGELPLAEDNGTSYLKMPLDVF
jgi:glyoxylase-like metal-dependent hydrolase (beta-lactamase superfamily II)